MKINEVEKLTGLSKKAIRLYESKGLLKIQRRSNSYRDYTEADVEVLKQIKLFRLAGISISNIKLLNDNVISVEKLLERRKIEIEREYGHYSSQYDFCESIIRQFKERKFDCKYSLEEDEELLTDKRGDLAVGLDIGTTNISACVIDIVSKKQIEFYNIPNSYSITGIETYYDEQDAEEIAEKTVEILNSVIDSYSNIRSVGITGQMHGILYTDSNGKAVSSLVTWRDKRADRIIKDGATYCDRIYELTNEKIYTGYGFSTHFYNTKSGSVPDGAYSFCSIMDYVAMKLTGRKKPLVHSSVAASFGLFDEKNNCFKKDAIEKLFADGLKLPDVTDGFELCGEYKGIPVSVAIGDNQASFLGSVKDHNGSILVNIGTGSQISMASGYCVPGDNLELRPLVKGKYLICGSALCGGSAYAMLESFFREYIKYSGFRDVSQYDIMNRLAQDAYDKNTKSLDVCTSFYGTRVFPEKKGAITGIDGKNFKPSNLVLGFIFGIARELYELFEGEQIHNKNKVIVSGGAVQKISVMKNVIHDIFGMPVYVNSNQEEASVGTALFSLVSANILKGTDDFSDYLNYK